MIFCWEMGAPARGSRIGDANARGARRRETSDIIEEGNMAAEGDIKEEGGRKVRMDVLL